MDNTPGYEPGDLRFESLQIDRIREVFQLVDGGLWELVAAGSSRHVVTAPDNQNRSGNWKYSKDGQCDGLKNRRCRFESYCFHRKYNGEISVKATRRFVAPLISGSNPISRPKGMR